MLNVIKEIRPLDITILVIGSMILMVLESLVRLSFGKFVYFQITQQKLIDLSKHLLPEDAQAELWYQVTQDLKTTHPALNEEMVIISRFYQVFIGKVVIPYFENKFLPDKKEID
jgi:hypothetical protein